MYMPIVSTNRLAPPIVIGQVNHCLSLCKSLSATLTVLGVYFVELLQEAMSTALDEGENLRDAERVMLTTLLIGLLSLVAIERIFGSFSK